MVVQKKRNRNESIEIEDGLHSVDHPVRLQIALVVRFAGIMRA